jgi:hypothetical protein
MYSLVVPDEIMLEGAIHTNGHVVAGFRSKDTKHEEGLDYLPKGYRDQLSFEDFWHRKFGLKFDPVDRTSTFLDGQQHSHNDFLNRIWKINMAIAEKHYIALYRGSVSPTQLLIRRYPNPETFEESLKWAERNKK